VVCCTPYNQRLAGGRPFFISGRPEPGERNRLKKNNAC
jgi:hypothetical protein